MVQGSHLEDNFASSSGGAMDLTDGTFTNNGVGLSISDTTQASIGTTDFGTGADDNTTADVVDDVGSHTGLSSNESFTCTNGDCGL